MGVLGPVTRSAETADDLEARGYGIDELRRELHAARKKRKKEDGNDAQIYFPANHLADKA